MSRPRLPDFGSPVHLTLIVLQPQPCQAAPDEHISLSAPKHNAVSLTANGCMACLCEFFLGKILGRPAAFVVYCVHFFLCVKKNYRELNKLK